MEKINKVIIENSYDKFYLQKEYDSILIITDDNVYKKQLDSFINVFKHKIIYEYIVTSGEDSKNLGTYDEIIRYCIQNNISRKSAVIAFGGGVVGDLAGYVASTYMRGIDLIQVPTTLLSQVDSSIGGKTGINIGFYKNIVGTFYQPELVYINVNSLKTLHEDEFIGGLAEVIKYSLVYDYEFLDYLIENSEDILNLNETKLLYIISKCVNAKLDIVKKDEKENDLRRILNLGHTFGHGIEKLGKLSHGFAVSIGTIMAFKFSLKRGYINSDYYDKLMEVYNIFNLPISFYDIDSKDIINLMKKDKKNSFGNFNLVIPVDYGKVRVIDDATEDEIYEVIEEIKNA